MSNNFIWKNKRQLTAVWYVKFWIAKKTTLSFNHKQKTFRYFKN